MSVFRKVFIASAIVGAGLGVAILLGEPASIKQAFVAAEQGWQAARSAGSSATGTSSAGGVQLVPESIVVATAGPSAGGPTSTLIEPRLTPIASPVPLPIETPDIVPRLATAGSAPYPTTTRFEPTPRARLRSEAPRPIGNEPRSPATIRRAPPTDLGAAAEPNTNRTHQLAAGWPAPTTLPVGYATSDNSAVATIAAYEVPESPNLAKVSPPPWPADEERNGSRMHVIIDGDSLERLANRYLDDPRRGREIYEMNREQLSSPDLLPIGVELKIPDRIGKQSR